MQQLDAGVAKPDAHERGERNQRKKAVDAHEQETGQLLRIRERRRCTGI